MLVAAILLFSGLFAISNGEITVAGVTIDEVMQRVMLDKHNDLRNDLALNGISESGQPSATYMNELHWDPVLAATAQQYTDKCNAGHNSYRNSDFVSLDSSDIASFNYDSNDLSIGENYLYYPRNDDKTIYEDAANFAELYWWDEHLDYNYDYDSCSGVCGHYTQMAWADTRYVGCGATLCDDWNGYEYLFLICTYYPSGNFYGKQAYPSGDSCSECSTYASDRDVCDGTTNGLCDGCQSADWNMCDDAWTNCADLGCPSDTTCQESPDEWPCEYCLDTCDGCPTTMLSPSPTCVDSYDGLTPKTTTTENPTSDTSAPTSSPTANPVPTAAPVPTLEPTTAPSVNISSGKISGTITVNGVSIDLNIQKIMLDLHNSLRNDLALNGISESGQPSATYMNELHWDQALAANSQQFTDKCNSGHNYNAESDFKSSYGDYSAFYYDSDELSLGENYLYYPTYGDDVADLAPQFAEKYWWDEHLDYDYDSDYCSGVCGHYTQMAWADTRYVGCGATLCDDYNGYEYLFLICEYYPSGNFYGKQAYPSGETCSDCSTYASDRDECDGTTNGLCDGCQSLWWNYCDDIFTNCDELSCPSESLCQSDPTNNYPCDYCRRSCSTCTQDTLSPAPTCSDADQGFPSTPTAPTTTQVTTTETATTPVKTTDVKTSTTTASTPKGSSTTEATTTAKVTTTEATTTKVTEKPTTTVTTTTEGEEWQNWYCTDYQQCYGYPIVCPDGKHCNVYCRGRQTCLKASIKCADNKKCNVYCSGEAACVGLTIYGDTASDLNIDTDGQYGVQLTEWTHSDGQAFTISDNDADSDNNDQEIEQQEENKESSNNESVLIIIICLLIVLCILVVIVGYFLHKRQMNELESKLTQSTNLIELNQDTQAVNNTQAVISAEESD